MAGADSRVWEAVCGPSPRTRSGAGSVVRRAQAPHWELGAGSGRCVWGWEKRDGSPRGSGLRGGSGPRAGCYLAERAACSSKAQESGASVGRAASSATSPTPSGRATAAEQTSRSGRRRRAVRPCEWVAGLATSPTRSGRVTAAQRLNRASAPSPETYPRRLNRVSQEVTHLQRRDSLPRA